MSQMKLHNRVLYHRFFLWIYQRLEKPINNARLVSFTTYETEVGRFVALMDECGGDFTEFWKRVKKLPRQEEQRALPPDP